MMIYTTLHRDYQREEWGFREALRELLANGLDGQERNTTKGALSIDYNEDTRVLRITNKGIKVPITALLVGTSESRSNNRCIGTFGEGLPMALLVLAREDRKVVIYNGEERWTPSIQRSPNFNDEPVLAIEKWILAKPGTDFIVELYDVTSAEYQEAISMFLVLDPAFDSEQVVSLNWRADRILTQPEFKGRIYNKGVFVLHHSEVFFGYDLDTVLNRDRSIIDTWDLRNSIGLILSHAVNGDNLAFADLIVEKLFANVDSLEVSDQFSELRFNRRLQQLAEKKFRADFGDKALPAKSLEEVRDAQFYGYQGVVVGELLYLVLAQSIGTLETVKTQYVASTTAIHQLEDLTQEERDNYDRAIADVKLAMPNWTGITQIVTFQGGGLLGRFYPESRRIELARESLKTPVLALSTLVHEVCHIVGPDGTSSHSEGQVTLLCSIIDQLHEVRDEVRDEKVQDR